MKADTHSAYLEEKEQLDKTAAYIRKYIEDNTPVWGRAADNKTAIIMAKVIQERYQQIKDVEPQPYFGRIDWHPENSDALDTFYIGKALIDEVGVYSWADTLAGELYYEGRSEQEKGEILLKRSFQIDYDTLTEISDEFIHPSRLQKDATQPQIEQDYTDSLLRNILRETRSGQLHDIVTTIQKQQYQIIRAPEDQILIVEGAPGSGKTQIALHRVAYLLYQDRKNKGTGQFKKILILGPNKLFVAYMEKVLPTLGERYIPQYAFPEWLNTQLGSEIQYESQYASLDALLNPEINQAEKAMRYRNARLKGSLKMAQLMERYVKFLQQELAANLTDLEVIAFTTSGKEIKVKQTKEELLLLLDSVSHLPFNQRRDAIEASLNSAIFQQMTQGRGSLSESLAKRLRDLIEKKVHGHFEAWQSLNVSVAYRRLLRTSHLLKEVSDGLFTDWQLELLTQDAPTALTPFRFDDLAALLYLKILLDGMGSPLYDHIVIDEAQDMTPLQFKVIAMYCRANSMTVLGDVFQGIFSHHGVSDWQELLEGVEGPYHSSVESIRRSYRSTSQIMNFANQMWRRTGVDQALLAEPFSRPGAKPVLNAVADVEEMVLQIQQIIENERADGWQSIAIICKTLEHCKKLAKALDASSLVDYQLLEDDSKEFQGGTAIVPIHLAKGLEFDVVILADVDSQSYPADLLHARLLFVAMTRASHALYLLWMEKISDLLEPSYQTDLLKDSFVEVLPPNPLTIEAYANKSQTLDPRWCVERLAAADKLHLLQKGQIDQTVLVVFLQPFVEAFRRSSSEQVIRPLPDKMSNFLRQKIHQASQAPPFQAGIAFSQMTYGLLRNQLRANGLSVSEQEESQVVEQIILLATYFQAIENNNLSITAGRWTTERRILDFVASPRVEMARKELNVLIDFGVVEASNAQIRVPPEWIPGLLKCALGLQPESWDKDLLAQLKRPVNLFPTSQAELERVYD